MQNIWPFPPCRKTRCFVTVSPPPRYGVMAYGSCLLHSWQALSPAWTKGSAPPSVRRCEGDSKHNKYQRCNIQATLVLVSATEPEAPLHSSSRSLGPSCPNTTTVSHHARKPWYTCLRGGTVHRVKHEGMKLSAMPEKKTQHQKKKKKSNNRRGEGNKKVRKIKERGVKNKTH